MARVGIKTYKNSALATVVSVIGSLFELGGITTMVNGGLDYLLVGFLLALWGAAHFVAAERLSDYAQYRTWKRQIEQKVDAEQIMQDEALAISIYSTNPCKRVLKYIQNLNPTAAEQIQQQIAAEGKQKKPKKGLIRAAAIGGALVVLLGIFTLVQSSKTPKFSVGSISGNHYSNRFLGIQCTLGNDWEVLSRKELAEENQITGNVTDEDYQKRMAAADQFYDLVASQKNSLNSLNLSIQKLSGAAGRISERQLVEQGVSESRQALEKIGAADITSNVSQITFAGKEHACIRLKATLSGVPIYTTQICIKVNDRVAILTVGTVLSDHTDEILSLFQSFQSE